MRCIIKLMGLIEKLDSTVCHSISNPLKRQIITNLFIGKVDSMIELKRNFLFLHSRLCKAEQERLLEIFMAMDLDRYGCMMSFAMEAKQALTIVVALVGALTIANAPMKSPSNAVECNYY